MTGKRLQSEGVGLKGQGWKERREESVVLYYDECLDLTFLRFV